MTTQLSVHHHDHDKASIAIFGFWVFLLSDFILFSTLFTSYVVLHHNTFGAIGVEQTVALPYVLVESFILLTSCFTYGLGTAAMHRDSRAWVMFWMFVSFVLGLAFVLMQYHVFAYLIQTGNSWHRSAFLSIFFVLLGMHWFHLLAGLLWSVILFIQMIGKGLTPVMKARVSCLGLFWVFLNLIWVFIFTIVFLMGAI